MVSMVLTGRTLRHVVDEGIPLSTLARPQTGSPSVICVVTVSTFTFVVHHDDQLEERLLLLSVESGDPVLPRGVAEQEHAALDRLSSVLGMTDNDRIRLPQEWSPFRGDDGLVSFFVCDRQASAKRWIAQVVAEGNRDLCVWDVQPASLTKTDLGAFTPPQDVYDAMRACWEEAWGTARARFSGSELSLHHAADMDLQLRPFGDVTQDASYSTWLERVTPQQRAFIEMEPKNSVRLRGPAGSGKTLTLELKALHETQRARKDGASLRILYVTHSWALATEVDENLERLSEWGTPKEITVLPLLEVAQDLLPAERSSDGLQLIGEDSLADKRAQLARIETLIDEFMLGDWLTFRGAVSEQLRARLDNMDPPARRAFAWDCLVEFGSVLGADGIFPGFDAERQYLRLPRAPWMMPLDAAADKKLVLHLYNEYYRQLQDERQLTSDQLVNDFLNYLETHIWNLRREKQGYDLVFVDEFHLFSVQERQLLRYLTRSTDEYPKLFMALDPRQSPWHVYGGLEQAQPESSGPQPDVDVGRVSSVDLENVHRFSPEILGLVKHINFEFPNLDLGAQWEVDFASVTSTAEPGPLPTVTVAGTQEAETIEIYLALQRARAATTDLSIALAIVDPDRFETYTRFMPRVQQGLKIRLTIVDSRERADVLGLRRKGLVVGAAEYLAGLQFDTVLIAGVPDTPASSLNYQRQRYLSLLYLSLTRASREVNIFVNEERGGIPEVLMRAKEQGLVQLKQGAKV